VQIEGVPVGCTAGEGVVLVTVAWVWVGQGGGEGRVYIVCVGERWGGAGKADRQGATAQCAQL
jgi:hypothetical protein